MATTTTTPTIATATSTTILAANLRRKSLRIQNASAANIMISLEGATLTGIAPTATNIGVVVPNGTTVTLAAGDICPTGILKAYQTSGGDINTVVVVEGS